MKVIYLIFILTNIFILIKNNEIESKYHYNKLKGVYRIGSYFTNYYFRIIKDKLRLLDTFSYFRLVLTKTKGYFIESVYYNKLLGIDDYDNIIFYSNKEKSNLQKMTWNIFNIDNIFLIQNKFSRKFIEMRNSDLVCKKKRENYFNNDIIMNTNFLFNFLKLYEEGDLKKNLKIINKEPIDIVIKYIDLTDKNLNRIGINQVYKDQDNEELKYSIRSILKYLPWIRKIFILMPNDKVKFFKSIEEIKYKIIYIKDKDFLGYDSANIFAFTFNLYKLENFGVSKNFIYMEDDFFIGKYLKKADFFYFDKNENKIYPYILTKHFKEMNATEIISKFNNLYQIKDSIFPHSSSGWWLSIYSTDIYFIEHYNHPLINTLYTHNAIPENIDDLKEIYKEIQSYKYINETLYNRERYILTLNQPHFLNLYQLNIKHKKVHSLSYKYIEMELIKKKIINTSLFVINTGGNHVPSNRQYKIQKKFMEKRFPFKTIFEIERDANLNINNKLKKFHVNLLKIFIIIFFIKIYNSKKNRRNKEM